MFCIAKIRMQPISGHMQRLQTLHLNASTTKSPHVRLIRLANNEPFPALRITQFTAHACWRPPCDVGGHRRRVLYLVYTSASVHTLSVIHSFCLRQKLLLITMCSTVQPDTRPGPISPSQSLVEDLLDLDRRSVGRSVGQWCAPRMQTTRRFRFLMLRLL